MSADTNLMPIPGAVDPVPVPRDASARADGRVELVGLSKDQIRAELEAAGLEPKQAKLRAKQVWHWIYNRGVSDFANMSDIAKPQRGWFAERFVISRPEVVEAQVSSDGTRKWLLKTHDGHDFEMVFIPDADRGHPVRVEPGRLHAQLPLLPHRHDGAGAQPRAGGDRRPGDARARCARRMAAASPKGGCSPTS